MKVTRIEDAASPAEQRRNAWGRNLSEAMDLHGYSVKSLHRILLDEGLDVSPQAIYAWRNGSSAPTVEKQVVLARVLRSPVSALFPPAAA